MGTRAHTSSHASIRVGGLEIPRSVKDGWNGIAWILATGICVNLRSNVAFKTYPTPHPHAHALFARICPLGHVVVAADDYLETAIFYLVVSEVDESLDVDLMSRRTNTGQQLAQLTKIIYSQ